MTSACPVTGLPDGVVQPGVDGRPAAVPRDDERAAGVHRDRGQGRAAGPGGVDLELGAERVAGGVVPLGVDLAAVGAVLPDDDRTAGGVHRHRRRLLGAASAGGVDQRLGPRRRHAQEQAGREQLDLETLAPPREDLPARRPAMHPHPVDEVAVLVDEELIGAGLRVHLDLLSRSVRPRPRSGPRGCRGRRGRRGRRGGPAARGPAAIDAAIGKARTLLNIAAVDRSGFGAGPIRSGGAGWAGDSFPAEPPGVFPCWNRTAFRGGRGSRRSALGVD